MGERLLVWTWILLPGCWALQGPREVSGFLGGSVEVPCEYEPELVNASKYWCRGISWLSCSILVQTTAPRVEVQRDRVSLRDDPTRHMFVVTMENLRMEDGDQYWCGIQVAWYDPMLLVKVSVLPVPSTTHYDLHMTQREEPTSAPTFPWTPLELENTTATLKARNLQASTPTLLVMILTPSTVLVLLLGIIIRCRMRRSLLQRSGAARPVGWKRDKDLQEQVTASWEREADSNNVYVNREWELSSPEDDYENSPATWQDFKKGVEVSVSRAPELQPIYMNTH